ncbi:hypothetical protein ACIG56_32100 [Nocardia fusca]|uniref:hypothetical protein n=1 Tax=Nocardia fusca TaxID=941183 RepID=UPI0037CACE92
MIAANPQPLVEARRELVPEKTRTEIRFVGVYLSSQGQPIDPAPVPARVRLGEAPQPLWDWSKIWTDRPDDFRWP